MRHHHSAVVLLVALVLGLSMKPAQAGIPVVDPNSIISAIEDGIQTGFQASMAARQALEYTKQLDQFAKQVEQYEKQLQQYGLQEDEFGVQQNQYSLQGDQYVLQEDQYELQEDQYKLAMLNTEAPDIFIWDQTQSTINGLIKSIDTLGQYQSSLGSIDAYLGQFRDVAYYKSSPCFSSDGCTETQMGSMMENQELSSESQKKANDALFKGLALQQANLEADAQKLVQLQTAAQDAEGRLAVLQYANQFASQQVHQLMQIRGLLMAQQNALAAEMQAQANRRAQEQVSGTRLRQGGFQTSPVRIW